MKKALLIFLMGFFAQFFFPASIISAEKALSNKNQDNILSKMGQAERKGIYQVNLYLQNPVYQPSDVLFFELRSDKEISQFELIWQKSLTAQEVKTLFKKDFQNVLDKKDLEALNNKISDFLKLLPGFQKGEKLILRWNPGGKVELKKGNQKIGEITSLPFAKALWSIWLGSHSVVNRILLISIYENMEVPD